MSKRQICIYQQTGILDLTAIQSLSACHVSPRATLPSPKAHGSHASEAALLAYLLPIQRPPPTKKTPEGQNKVSYLWMCQHGTSWNPGCTLSNEPDNSTGAFSSQEKWYLQKHCQDETRSCAEEATVQRESAGKSPRYYPALISGNPTCYKGVNIKCWIMMAWGSGNEQKISWVTSEGYGNDNYLGVRVCSQVCACAGSLTSSAVD